MQAEDAVKLGTGHVHPTVQCELASAERDHFRRRPDPAELLDSGLLLRGGCPAVLEERRDLGQEVELFQQHVRPLPSALPRALNGRARDHQPLLERVHTQFLQETRHAAGGARRQVVRLRPER